MKNKIGKTMYKINATSECIRTSNFFVTSLSSAEFNSRHTYVYREAQVFKHFGGSTTTRYERVEFATIIDGMTVEVHAETNNVDTMEISFYVEGGFEYVGRSKVSITKWLLNVWSYVKTAFSNTIFECIAFDADGRGDYRAGLYKKLGFEEEGCKLHFLNC